MSMCWRHNVLKSLGWEDSESVELDDMSEYWRVGDRITASIKV